MAKVKDSQSNGIAERAIQEHEGMVRTMNLALERRLGEEVLATRAIMHWLVEHAAMILNRYHAGQDGSTAYDRIRGKRYKRR